MSELLQEIKQQSLTVSAEAISLGNAFSAIPAQFNLLVDNVKKQFSTLSFNSLTTLQNLDARAATRVVERYDYTTMNMLYVHVPTGYNFEKARKAGGMEKYAEVMLEGGKLLNESVEKTLRPAANYFGRLVGDPDYILRISHDILRDIPIVKIEARINEYKSEINQFFDLTNPSTTVTFGEVYQNVKQYTTVLESDRQLQDILNRTDHKDTLRLIDSIVTYTEEITRIVRTSNKQEINNNVLKGISDILFQLATVAEFYGSYYQFALEFHHALEDTVEKLKKDLK